MIKTIASQMAAVVDSRGGRRNLRILLRFSFALATMISVYSVTFHFIMQWEGRDYSWITGLYWTLTVMSTLGLGEIVFMSDLGKLFTIVVLVSGTIFLLVLLPFTFIEFFYGPWINAQAAARAPRKLPPDIRGHVLLTHYDAVTSSLIRRLEQYDYPYALLVSEIDDALRLHDLGLNVVVGNTDDPETWENARVREAALVACTDNDFSNTSAAFTARACRENLQIITSASDTASDDILKLAGSNFVLHLEEMIGQSFARRTVGGDAKSHVIGEFAELLIAEATAHGTPLVGKTLTESRLREVAGVTVVGVWERGRFEAARPETRIQDNTVLVMAGTQDHLDRYDEFFCIYNISTAPVVILGGGRVGRATAAQLRQRGVDYRIVEELPDRVLDDEKYVQGSAADLAVLERAGINETSTVIITTHNDNLNVYLTIYCRQLRPDIQILCRATNERNVATLHRAEADSVLSYASMGASAIMNVLEGNKIVMVAEGLDLFEVRVPDELAGRTIADSTIRERTGCSVVAIQTQQGMNAVPNPYESLSADGEIVLIGTADAERRFLELYGKGGNINGRRRA